jgi:hypothetical protein
MSWASAAGKLVRLLRSRPDLVVEGARAAGQALAHVLHRTRPGHPPETEAGQLHAELLQARATIAHLEAQKRDRERAVEVLARTNASLKRDVTILCVIAGIELLAIIYLLARG